jgi:hypothetical protein
MPRCTACQDLDIYQLKIPIETVRLQAMNGCSACTLLEQSTGHFVDSCDNIASLELLVDCALYVSLIDADGSKLKVIELYTDIGEQNRSHAKITISCMLSFFTAQLVKQPTSYIKISSENINSDSKANRK